MIAGDGSAMFNGDGISAIDAGIDPAGLAVGADGALYIADETNRRLRHVSGGSITTVAGNGDDGYSGDGNVPATGSPLTPYGVAVATDGTLFVTDRIHNVVRSVDLCANEMWSVAGSGQDSAFLRRAGGPQTNAGEDIIGPTRIAVTANGRMYIVAEGNAIYRIARGGALELVKDAELICGGYSCFPEQVIVVVGIADRVAGGTHRRGTGHGLALEPPIAVI